MSNLILVEVSEVHSHSNKKHVKVLRIHVFSCIYSLGYRCGKDRHRLQEWLGRRRSKRCWWRPGCTKPESFYFVLNKEGEIHDRIFDYTGLDLHGTDSDKKWTILFLRDFPCAKVFDCNTDNVSANYSPFLTYRDNFILELKENKLD